jgi:hypothetical protein
MTSCGMLRHVALVRTDVSEELSASISKVIRVGELGTILAVTSNRRTLRRNTFFWENNVRSIKDANVLNYICTGVLYSKREGF